MTHTIQALRFRGQVDEPTAFQFIRRDQRVPGVLLGRHDTEQILSLDANQVEAAIGQHDEACLVRLDVEGETIWARVSDADRDALTQVIGYVELTQMPPGEPVAVDVPIEVLSKSAPRTRGQVVQQVESLRIVGPVESLPDVLRVDARRLQVDETITVADLALPDRCQPVELPPETVLVVALPKPAPAGKKRKAVKQ